MLPYKNILQCYQLQLYSELTKKYKKFFQPLQRGLWFSYKHTKLFSLRYISLLRKRSFIFILFVSSLLGVSINRFLLTWRFIEVNLLAFIPFISLEKKANPHILGLKYFLTQALGSIFLLVSYVYIRNSSAFFRLFFLLRII